MIGRLTGIIVEHGLDGACIVDVAGVGYEVHVPLGTLGRLPAPPERATLHVHTQMREDAPFLTTQQVRYRHAHVIEREFHRVLLALDDLD